MVGEGEAALLAIRLPARSAAVAVLDAWGRGEAVTVLDRAAPAGVIARHLAVLRPTHLLDGGGRRALPGGRPVGGGTGAVVLTSGTTAGPKAVELTRRGLDASARAVHAALGGDPAADTWLACLPLHHVGGLALLARHRATGARLVVHDRFEPRAVAHAPTREAATLVSLVPTMLRRILDCGGHVGGFRRVLLGGGPVADELAAVEGTVTTYGLTETGGGCVHDGRPLHGVEVALDAAGEILVRGPVVMAGYRLDPAATAAAFTGDGWLRTGDVGAIDADGRLRVVDRVGDLIVTGGVNVSPAAVEAVLGTHPSIADVCVTGAADPEWGERVVAHVVPCGAMPPPRLADLRSFARDRLPASHLPRELRLVDAIPRTPGGKPRRGALRSAGE